MDNDHDCMECGEPCDCEQDEGGCLSCSDCSDIRESSIEDDDDAEIDDDSEEG